MRLSKTALGVLVLAFISGSQFGSYLKQLILAVAGKAPPSTLNRLENHGKTGLDGCRLLYTDRVEACEDMVIYGNEAFLACGNTADRAAFYPGGGKFGPESSRANWDEPVFKLDLATGNLGMMKKVGWTGDSILHGMAIWEFPADPKRIHLFFVNHIRNASCITIYEHKLGSQELIFRKNVCHSLIVTPNAIAPTGPYSFYWTNSRINRQGFRRKLENKFGPFKWSTIGHCDLDGNCRIVIDKDIQLPNGITTIDNGRQLLVADTIGGSVMRYAIKENKDVVMQEKIEIGSALDNLRTIPNSRDVLMAGFPEFDTFKTVIGHPGDETYKTQAVGIRITPAILGSLHSSYKIVYWDDGSIMSLVTTLATSDDANVAIGGSVYNKGLVYCNHTL